MRKSQTGQDAQAKRGPSGARKNSLPKFLIVEAGSPGALIRRVAQNIRAYGICRVVLVPLTLLVVSVLIPGCPPPPTPKVSATYERNAAGSKLHVESEKDTDVAIDELDVTPSTGKLRLRGLRYGGKASPVLTARYPEQARYYDSVDRASDNIVRGVGILAETAPKVLPLFLRNAADTMEAAQDTQLFEELSDALASGEPLTPELLAFAKKHHIPVLSGQTVGVPAASQPTKSAADITPKATNQ